MMNLEKLVVVQGRPGVHRIVATRNNGLIVYDVVEKISRFVPLRVNQFTPLGTISMYIESDEDSIPLAAVWQKMYEALPHTPLVSANAGSVELRNYFSAVVPEHDRERVHINDIKKCVKWFSFALEHGLIAEAIAAAEKTNSTETTADEPTSESSTN